jgi:hypothetical protein
MKISLYFQVALMVLSAEILTDAYMNKIGHEALMFSPANMVIALVLMEMYEVYFGVTQDKMKRFLQHISVVAVFTMCILFDKYVLTDFYLSLSDSKQTLIYYAAFCALVLSVRYHMFSIRQKLEYNDSRAL